MSWRRKGNDIGIWALILCLCFLLYYCNTGKPSLAQEPESKAINAEVVIPNKKDVKGEESAQIRVKESTPIKQSNPQVEFVENDTIVKIYDDNHLLLEEINLVNENPWLNYFTDKSVSMVKYSDYADIDLGNYQLTEEETKLLYAQDRDPELEHFNRVTFISTFLGRRETDFNKKAIVANYRVFGFNASGHVVAIRSILGVFQVKDGAVEKRFIDIKGDAIEFMIEPNLNLILAQGGGIINEDGGKITNSRIYKIDLENDDVEILMEGRGGEVFSSIAFDQPNWMIFHKDYDVPNSWKRELFIYNTETNVIRSKMFYDRFHAPQRIVNDSLQLWEAPSIAVTDIKLIQ